MDKKQSKEKIIEELRKFGTTITFRKLKKRNGRLLRDCVEYYGSFNNAKKTAGLPIKEFGRRFILDPSIKTITPALGYVVGAVLGDGWVYYNEVKLEVVDKTFADYFAKQLKILSGKKPKIYVSPERKRIDKNRGKTWINKKMFRVSLASIEFAKFLKERISNFSWIYKSSKEVKRMVLKGFFDAEGSINIENKIEFANNNPKIIELFMKLCKDFNISTNTIGKSKNKIRILGGIRGKTKFYNEVGITIPRKKERLEEHLTYYNKRVDAYKLAMKLRKKGIPRKKIREKLKNQKYKIPRGTIGGWFYRKIKPWGYN